MHMSKQGKKNPQKQKFPESELIQRIQQVEQKQEHEDSGHAVYRSWCAACVEGRGVGGQHRIELLEEEKRERTIPIVAFDYGFLTQENADTFQILILPRQQVWSNGSDML